MAEATSREAAKDQKEATFSDSFDGVEVQEQKTGPDREFMGRVKEITGESFKFYQKLANENKDNPASQIDFEMEKQIRSELLKLSVPKQVERIVANSNQREVVYGLSRLSGMGIEDSPAHEDYDPDEVGEDGEDVYTNARGLHQKCCAKIYPEVGERLEEKGVSINAQMAVMDVGRLTLPNYEPPARSEGISFSTQIQRGKGKAALERLKVIEVKLKEAIYDSATANMRSLHEEKQKGYDPGMEENLNQANEALYRLSLVVDKLDAELYGQASSEEKDEIDGIREQIDGEDVGVDSDVSA